MNLVYCNQSRTLIEHYNMFVLNGVVPSMPEQLHQYLTSVSISENPDKDTYCACHFQILLNNTSNLSQCENLCSSKVIEYQLQFGLDDIATNIEEDKLLCTLSFKNADFNQVSDGILQLYMSISTSCDIKDIDLSLEVSCTNTYYSFDDTLITSDFYEAISFPDSILLNTVFRFSLSDEQDKEQHAMDYLKLSMLVGKILNNTSNYKLVLDENSEISLSVLTDTYCKLSNIVKTAYIKRKIRDLILQDTE